MPDGLPKWFGGDKNKRKRINDRSRRMENDHAKAVGGRPQAGSGSSWRAPQDVRSQEFLDQHKFTDADSFRFAPKQDWKPLAADALRDGRTPRFVVEFPHLGLKFYLTEADDQ